MYITHQQEEFSKAFVHAVASAAGFKVQPGASPDDDSIDLSISARGPFGAVRSPKVDVQLKCWQVEPGDGESLSYPLKVKNYDDLRPPMNEFQVPRILVVVMVPKDVADWATHTPEALLLRYRARWVCLHGLPETENDTTVSVPLPSDQPFTKASLTAMMERVGQGGRP